MSTIIASNISDGTTSVASTYVVNGSAKAWVNQNAGTTIRGSFNISSLVDQSVGAYLYNFSSGMVDGNYPITTSAFRDDNTYTGVYFNDNTASNTATRHYTRGTTTRADTDTVYVSVQGDLA